MLHATSRGEGPAVLLLHGLAASGHFFDPLDFPGYRVVAVDLLGFGRSPKPHSSYSLATHAREVHAVMRKLRIKRPIIIGHSFGAVVALAYAKRYGAAGVICIGTPVFPSREGGVERLRHLSPLARTMFDHRRIGEAICMFHVRFPRLGGMLARAGGVPAPYAHDAILHTWESYDNSLQALLGVKIARMLPRCAVFFVHGARDRVTPLAAIRAFCKTRHCRLTATDDSHAEYIRNPATRKRLQRLLGEINA
jgi:pimeloyl-ACP methyl ester carboxylesterase